VRRSKRENSVVDFQTKGRFSRKGIEKIGQSGNNKIAAPRGRKRLNLTHILYLTTGESEGAEEIVLRSGRILCCVVSGKRLRVWANRRLKKPSIS